MKPCNAVEINQGNFNISISAGQLKLGGQMYFAVSPATPIAPKRMGLKVGESFSFNWENYAVSKVH